MHSAKETCRQDHQRSSIQRQCTVNQSSSGTESARWEGEVASSSRRHGQGTVKARQPSAFPPGFPDQRSPMTGYVPTSWYSRSGVGLAEPEAHFRVRGYVASHRPRQRHVNQEATEGAGWRSPTVRRMRRHPASTCPGAALALGNPANSACSAPLAHHTRKDSVRLQGFREPAIAG